ncbi:unnamed protein product [Moneuplotes crassus]|uniref:Uncharacterized protein n=1 Tax=Euplotes crassus TaxID=5936 RepID=A0AAD2D5L3_EUPCR|nr:unnamed protein product [Moneuplotes crassus]
MKSSDVGYSPAFQYVLKMSQSSNVTPLGLDTFGKRYTEFGSSLPSLDKNKRNLLQNSFKPPKHPQIETSSNNEDSNKSESFKIPRNNKITPLNLHKDNFSTFKTKARLSKNFSEKLKNAEKAFDKWSITRNSHLRTKSESASTLAFPMIHSRSTEQKVPRMSSLTKLNTYVAKDGGRDSKNEYHMDRRRGTKSHSKIGLFLGENKFTPTVLDSSPKGSPLLAHKESLLDNFSSEVKTQSDLTQKMIKKSEMYRKRNNNGLKIFSETVSKPHGLYPRQYSLSISKTSSHPNSPLFLNQGLPNNEDGRLLRVPTLERENDSSSQESRSTAVRTSNLDNSRHKRDTKLMSQSDLYQIIKERKRMVDSISEEEEEKPERRLKGLIGKIDRKIPRQRIIHFPKKKYTEENPEKAKIQAQISNPVRMKKKNMKIIPGKLSHHALQVVREKKQKLEMKRLQNRHTLIKQPTTFIRNFKKPFRRTTNPASTHEFIQLRHPSISPLHTKTPQKTTQNTSKSPNS